MKLKTNVKAGESSGLIPEGDFVPQDSTNEM
jgi:hypothetical protein